MQKFMGKLEISIWIIGKYKIDKYLVYYKKENTLFIEINNRWSRKG